MNALFGGPLAGNKLVRVVYLDEAGIGNPRHEKHVTVAGVITHGDYQLRKVENHLSKLVRKHVPEHQRKGFVFHATDIFNGGKMMPRDDPYWTQERRLAVASDLAKIPAKFRLKIVLGASPRENNPLYKLEPGELTPSDKTGICFGGAYLFCCLSIEKWMRKHAPTENCLLICEETGRFKSFLRDLQQHGQRVERAKTIESESHKYLPFKHIREDPLFQAKRPGSVLEIADFCAYVFKRMIPMDDTAARFNPYYQPWLGQVYR